MCVLSAQHQHAGGKDFQNLELVQGGELFEEVLRKSAEWAGNDQLMYVVGATRAESLQRIRKIVPDHFLLVPGVGAQGGSLEEVSRYGMNSECGLLVNSSRGIIYASDGEDFAKVAGQKSQELQQQMSKFLIEFL